jgi:flagellar basal-body rod modification protein FlgD
MTTVTPTTATPATAPTNVAQAAQQQLAGNFNTFLTLLTTQLQNQDPMSPMDSNQFTQQLVEFSGVEQQINTNDNLKSLISLAQGRSASDAVGYLGKIATITNGNAALSGGKAAWSYSLDGASSATALTITDSTGRVVYTAPGETSAGTHDFTWNGQDNGGNQLPDGVYTLNVTPQSADGSAISTSVASSGVVNEVNLTGSEPLMMIGPMAVPMSQIAAVDG